MNPRPILLMILVCLALFSCQPSPTPSPTFVPYPTTTLYPLLTPTSTPAPIASEKNPLVIGFIGTPEDNKLQVASKEVASQIKQITAFVVDAQFFSNYQALVKELTAGKVHIAFLPPLTFLFASQQGAVNASLISSHLGVYQYGFRIFANVNQKFTSFYDPIADRSTAGATAALKQLRDKQPCWVEPGSPSGHVAPLGTLANENYLVKTGAFLGSPASVIRALYITGICDFGATFSTTGDPRTSPTVQQDLTDIKNRVVILWQSEPIIPNLNLSMVSSLKDDMREDLTFAFQALMRSSSGKAALSSALNYEIQDFKAASESTYQALMTLVQAAKFDLAQFLGK